MLQEEQQKACWTFNKTLWPSLHGGPLHNNTTGTADGHKHFWGMHRLHGKKFLQNGRTQLPHCTVTATTKPQLFYWAVCSVTLLQGPNYLNKEVGHVSLRLQGIFKSYSIGFCYFFQTPILPVSWQKVKCLTIKGTNTLPREDKCQHSCAFDISHKIAHYDIWGLSL